MAGGQVKNKSSMKKDPGISGTLEIMEGMLLFVPDDLKSDSKIEVQTQNIESHKYSKEPHKPPLFKLTNKQGRSHTFVFENYTDMHACRDIITKALARGEEEPKKSTEQPSIADLVLRIKLLRENSELQRFHKQFVGSKVLTEDEFWSTKKKLLGKHSVGKWKHCMRYMKGFGISESRR